MMAWGKNQGAEGSIVKMVGDTHGNLTYALGLALTHPGPVAKLGTLRCKRHAIYAEDGVIKALEVAESANDPAGDDYPEKTLVENMMSKIPDLAHAQKESVLAKLEAEKRRDIDAAASHIKAHDLVLFVKPSCAFSEGALETLQVNGFFPRVVKVTRCEKRGLQHMTGQTSMPSAWVKGSFIGGCNDGPEPWQGVKPLVSNGKLREMMSNSKLSGA
jgi:glutaredoxin-related protein